MITTGGVSRKTPTQGSRKASSTVRRRFIASRLPSPRGSARRRAPGCCSTTSRLEKGLVTNASAPSASAICRSFSWPRAVSTRIGMSLKLRVALHEAQHLHAVLLRQHDVEDDDGRAQVLDRLQRQRPVLRPPRRRAPPARSGRSAIPRYKARPRRSAPTGARQSSRGRLIRGLCLASLSDPRSFKRLMRRALLAERRAARSPRAGKDGS